MDTISFSSDQVSKQILVVEDDYDIGDIVENYLKKNGFQVLRAINGQQAIEIHAQQHIDLVILDVKLPILNGWEVLNHIRQSKQTPVIMLTALDQEIDILKELDEKELKSKYNIDKKEGEIFLHEAWLRGP